MLDDPERKLKKGTGFHSDFLLASTLNLISGIMGTPLMTAVCVKTVSHANALAIVNKEAKDGKGPKILGAHGERSINNS